MIVIVSYLKEVLHCIYALELWADKADLTLENWYELASNIPGHNANEFETWQLEIWEISAFLKATWNLCFGLCVPTRLLLFGVDATYCNLEPKLRFEISKQCHYPGAKLTRHCLEQVL